MSKPRDVRTCGLHQTEDKKFLVKRQWPVCADLLTTGHTSFFFLIKKRPGVDTHATA